jgi:hypothetical protein
MHLAWPLHVAAMAVFVAMGFNLAGQQKREPTRQATGLFANWCAAGEQHRDFQSKLVGCVPWPLRAVCVVAFIYALINFALFAMHMEGGSPAVENGNYYLHNHGHKIRDLSKEEYQRFVAYVVRGFSGHWMLFSIIPTAYFLTVYPKLQQSMGRR